MYLIVAKSIKVISLNGTFKINNTELNDGDTTFENFHKVAPIPVLKRFRAPLLDVSQELNKIELS